MNTPPRLHVQLPRLSVALVCLLGCLLLAAPAQAAWPGKNGAIAFRHSWDGGQGDIWIAQPSGRQRGLTHSPKSETGPVFSPDGRTIAFVRYEEEGSDIWLMDSDGTDKRPLVNNARYDFNPHFFPSGRSLAFESGYPGGSRIFTIRTDGTGLQQWVVNASDPAISANGRWLAYVRNGGDRRIVLEDLRTGKARQLPNGKSEGLDFSPDSRRLVYTTRRKCRPKGNLRYAIMTVGLRAEHPRVLLSGCGDRFIPFAPVWSPDGRRIVFTHVEDLGSRPDNHHLAMMTADGTLIPGALRHAPGTLDGWASWQPLP